MILYQTSTRDQRTSWYGIDRYESVRDLEIILGPGRVRSQVLKLFSVLVQFGPRYRNFSWSWSGPVPEFKFLSVLVRSGPRLWSVDLWHQHHCSCHQYWLILRNSLTWFHHPIENLNWQSTECNLSKQLFNKTSKKVKYKSILSISLT